MSRILSKSIGERCKITIPIQINISLGEPVIDSPPTLRSGSLPAVENLAANSALEAALDQFDVRFSLDTLKQKMFNWGTALSLALASRLAYADSAAVIDRARGSWKFETCRFMEADATECFIATSPEVVLIAFRGTQGTRDWLADFNAFSIQRPSGIVHRGFYHQFLAVQTQLENALSQFPARPIVLTGHSLGGAIANIVAAEWHNKYEIRSIYTYGQPAVGRGDFVPFMNSHYGRILFRFVNNNDIVPQVPPNFRHIGRLFKFDAAGSLLSELESLPTASDASREQMITEAEFDQLRAKLLEERAAERRGTIAMENLHGEALEAFFPRLSVSDHYMLNYITKIAAQLPMTQPLVESVVSSVPSSAGKQPRSVANFNAVSKALGRTRTMALGPDGFPQSVSSFSQLNQFALSIEAPEHRTAFMQASVVALDELQESTEEADLDVFHSPSNQMAALMQSGIESPAKSEALEFPFDHEDIGAVLDPIRAVPPVPHPIQRPVSDVPQIIADDARIFLVSDFGTGLYGAPVTALTILNSGVKYDLLIHLGDIYYSGQVAEVQTRFLDIWPTAAGKVSRNLNGNHDMYSGGYGYFDHALPAFEQSSSYFAFQNSNWLLLGLDTAWQDNELDSEQVAWIVRLVEQAGSRKVILFSHHPLFSIKKEPLKNGQDHHDGLRQLLDQRKIFAWYWGHEHHCIVYDRHPDYKIYARCIGHGGMPYKRKDFKELDKVLEVGTAKWLKLPQDQDTPGGLALDGPNEFIIDHETKYGPHGYMTLQFHGTEITEEFHTPRGEILLKSRLRGLA